MRIIKSVTENFQCELFILKIKEVLSFQGTNFEWAYPLKDFILKYVWHLYNSNEIHSNLALGYNDQNFCLVIIWSSTLNHRVIVRIIYTCKALSHEFEFIEIHHCRIFANGNLRCKYIWGTLPFDMPRSKSNQLPYAFYQYKVFFSNYLWNLFHVILMWYTFNAFSKQNIIIWLILLKKTAYNCISKRAT